MKKFLIPLLTIVVLFTGCKKDPDTLVTNVTNITNNNGAYVYTEYPKVGWDQWTDCTSRHEDGTVGIDYMYYTYFNDYIDDNLVNNSFALVYLVDADGRDNICPCIIEYTYNNIKRKAIVRYDVGFDSGANKNGVTFIVEAVDGDYTALHACVPDEMSFKVCMMLNPEPEEN